MLFTQTVDKVLLLQGFVYNLKSAAADCFFYLYTLFCIWMDSYFYCPIYFPHLISICWQMISIAASEQYVLFYYNTIPLQEQVFSFLSIKIFWVFMRFMGYLWAFMLKSTIHLTTWRGRRILVIYYVKSTSDSAAISVRFLAQTARHINLYRVIISVCSILF